MIAPQPGKFQRKADKAGDAQLRTVAVDLLVKLTLCRGPFKMKSRTLINLEGYNDDHSVHGGRIH